MARKGGAPENLKPFQKGADPRRNMKGRPKVLPPLDKLLNEVLGSDLGEKSQAEVVLDSLLARAKKGDVRAAEILLDRAYGKPKQQIENTNHNYDMTALTPEKVKELEELKKKEF